MNDGDNTMLLE